MSLPPLVTGPELAADPRFSGSAADAVALADVVSARIRAWCGWHIAPSVTETIKLDGPGGGLLMLPTLHLTDLIHIENNGNEIIDPEWSQIGVVRARCRRWTSRFRGIEVEMTHGFPTVPAELIGMALEIGLRLWTVDGWVRSEQTGGVSVSYFASTASGGFLMDETQVLGRYKL